MIVRVPPPPLEIGLNFSIKFELQALVLFWPPALAEFGPARFSIFEPIDFHNPHRKMLPEFIENLGHGFIYLFQKNP